MEESCEEGALRELKEETGLTGAYIEQFHTFSDPNRDPRERVITVAFYALVRIQDVKGGDDAARAAWFALDAVPQLAFDHDRILREALKRLRERIHFEPIGFELLPEKFTLTTPKREAYLYSFNEESYNELKQKGFRLEF